MQLIKRIWWETTEAMRWLIQCRHTYWTDECEVDGWLSGWRHCRICGFTQQLFYEERNSPRPVKGGCL